MNTLNLTQKDIYDLARIAQAEAQNIARLKGVSPRSAYGSVVDVVTNRVASGRAPTVQGVISQPKQFSPIARYGGLDNLPAPNAETLKTVQGYLTDRSQGGASVVGKADHFLNPNTAGRGALNTWASGSSAWPGIGEGQTVHKFGSLGQVPDYSIAVPDGGAAQRKWDDWALNGQRQPNNLRGVGTMAMDYSQPNSPQSLGSVKARRPGLMTSLGNQTYDPKGDALAKLVSNAETKMANVDFSPVPQAKGESYMPEKPSGIVTHWSGSQKSMPQALNQLSRRDPLRGFQPGYQSVIDAGGNVAMTGGYNEAGLPAQRNHTWKQNAGNVGIATTGIEPNQRQVASGKLVGDYYKDLYGPGLNVRGHGVAAQGATGSHARQLQEGATLAGAINNGQPSTAPPQQVQVAAAGGYAPPRPQPKPMLPPQIPPQARPVAPPPVPPPSNLASQGGGWGPNIANPGGGQETLSEWHNRAGNVSPGGLFAQMNKPSAPPPVTAGISGSAVGGVTNPPAPALGSIGGGFMKGVGGLLSALGGMGGDNGAAEAHAAAAQDAERRRREWAQVALPYGPGGHFL